MNNNKKGPAKKRGSGIGRRQNQSKLLDGEAIHGAQSLLEMCIKVRLATYLDSSFEVRRFEDRC